MTSLTVRKAISEDMDIVADLIQELSDHENVSEKAQLTGADLRRDGGFEGKSEQPALFTCFVAEQAIGQVVGYALCFFKTFTIKRRTLFVDSLFVRRAQLSGDDQWRQVVTKLAETLREYARDHGCSRLDFHLLQNSELVPVWQQLGAEDITVSRDLHHLRLHLDAIDKLVEA